MYLDTQISLDWQQRGMNARVLGVKIDANPVLPYVSGAQEAGEKEEWIQKAEAWSFGWCIEDASRSVGDRRHLFEKFDPISLSRETPQSLAI
ncbi:hypothetical protein GOZ80_08030 [Agrobacterium vitis]|uniref:Uncharacterized protein n=1 Tax=Agrobacterium vitis TaxID=373 RepID=A0ABD6GCF7_AGRVI|nr:CrpP-related protein [Agrobacterium vitis]MUO79738.1 hypothetical protein [Agrobacterium vitis]MUO93773.1 hypothetical protein [Agrobacterium vitis]MUP03976.1 hypothetical protein [Agrobacterium vitis]MVA91969.1 hypothetical protein [Agrobacterium vitis]MVB01462.1 hypothetical protein [Agrobacterium vitis]